MNREILFRGKRIDNGEWVEGYLRFGPDMKDAYIGCFVDYIDEGLHTDYLEFRVFSATIGQSTGLTDKNGKKIFEGDVVEVVRSGDETWCCVVSDIRYIPSKMCGSYVKSREVIGNIHDNPELMEGD